MPRLLHEITPFDGQYHYHNVTLVQNVNQGIQCIFERGWGKGIFIFYNLKMKFKRSSKNVSSCRNKVRDMLKNFHLSQCRYCDRVMLIMLIIWCFLDLLLDLAVNFVLKNSFYFICMRLLSALCTCTIRILIPWEFRRLDPLNWSYGRFESPCESWEWNLVLSGKAPHVINL